MVESLLFTSCSSSFKVEGKFLKVFLKREEYHRRKYGAMNHHLVTFHIFPLEYTWKFAFLVIHFRADIDGINNMSAKFYWHSSHCASHYFLFHFTLTCRAVVECSATEKHERSNCQKVTWSALQRCDISLEYRRLDTCMRRSYLKSFLTLECLCHFLNCSRIHIL